MSIPWRLYFRHIVVWPLPLPCKQKHSADARIHLACLFTRTFTLWHRHLYFLRFPSLGMLSPRTMSLRIKSKVLLQAVDKYLSMTSQNDFYDKINIDGLVDPKCFFDQKFKHFVCKLKFSVLTSQTN